MGYYSEVGIVLKKELYKDFIENLSQYKDKKIWISSFIELIEKKTTISPVNNDYFIHFDYIKWNKEINRIVTNILEDFENDYYFYRIGEDLEDIETFGEYIDNDFSLDSKIELDFIKYEPTNIAILLDKDNYYFILERLNSEINKNNIQGQKEIKKMIKKIESSSDIFNNEVFIHLEDCVWNKNMPSVKIIHECLLELDKKKYLCKILDPKTKEVKEIGMFYNHVFIPESYSFMNKDEVKEDIKESCFSLSR